MSANAAPIGSGVTGSRGWSGVLSRKTLAWERRSPTEAAAVLLPDPGRPSMNRILGPGMDMSLLTACISNVTGFPSAEILESSAMPRLPRAQHRLEGFDEQHDIAKGARGAQPWDRPGPRRQTLRP